MSGAFTLLSLATSLFSSMQQRTDQLLHYCHTYQFNDHECKTDGFTHIAYSWNGVKTEDTRTILEQNQKINLLLATIKYNMQY